MKISLTEMSDMEFTEEASRLMDRKIKSITKNINLYDKEREDIENELRSNYFETACAIAQKRGSGIVEEEDVKTAFQESADPEEIAACLTKSHADSFKRAGIFPRTIAFVIDIAAIILTVLLLIMPLILIMPFTQNIDQTSAIVAFLILSNLFIGIVILGVIFGYFIVLEERYGQTPGKRIMGLKVLKTDGTKIGYKEAVLRNIPKFINNLIFLDALIMLIFYNEEKQRGFDKVANTMVVHLN